MTFPLTNGGLWGKFERFISQKGRSRWPEKGNMWKNVMVKPRHPHTGAIGHQGEGSFLKKKNENGIREEISLKEENPLKKSLRGGQLQRPPSPPHPTKFFSFPSDCSKSGDSYRQLSTLRDLLQLKKTHFFLLFRVTRRCTSAVAHVPPGRS
jgi:hypothetical protein